jgi:hypothetical protein
MAYDEFTLERVLGDFSLELEQRGDLIGRVAEVEVRPSLRDRLDEGVRLAVDVNTDKARGELIIAPIVAEVRFLSERRISMFSGTEFNVSEGHGLTGVCDFILARSPLQLIFEDPAVIIVEARNEDIPVGLGRCGAQMVAARMLNEREGHGPTTIHGAVTSGIIWRFLKLESNKLIVEMRERYLDPVGKILGILLHCAGVGPAPAGVSAEDRRGGHGPVGGTLGSPR